MSDNTKQSFTSIGDKIKRFFVSLGGKLKARGVGFYLLLFVVLLSLAVPFVYMRGFLNTEYIGVWAIILPFFTVAVFVMVFFKKTARYAPFVMFGIVLAAFLVFVKTSYMHLSTAFFGGVTGNVFVKAGFSFSFCTIAYVTNILVCITAMFVKQYRGEKDYYTDVKAESVAEIEITTEEATNEQR